MASLNKVFLIGNLTRDPDLRYTPGGMAVCDLGLATTRRFTVNNQDREETCFVDITVWGKVGENCKNFLEKGSPVMVEGRLQLDQWEDQNGVKKSKLRVVAESVQFLGARRNPQGGEGGNYNPGSAGGGSFRQNYSGNPGSSYGGNASSGNPQQSGSYGRSNPVPAAPPIPPPSFAPPSMPGAGGTASDSEEDIPF